jgi:hypothetical protein
LLTRRNAGWRVEPRKIVKTSRTWPGMITIGHVAPGRRG